MYSNWGAGHTDIIDINNYIVLVEQSDDKKETTETCLLDDKVIGFSFYGSGDVEVIAKYKNKK